MGPQDELLACSSEISFCQNLALVDQFSSNKTCFFCGRQWIKLIVLSIGYCIGYVFPFLVVVFRLLRKPFLYMAGEILLRTHPVENCFFVFKLSLALLMPVLPCFGVRSFVHRCTPHVQYKPWRPFLHGEMGNASTWTPKRFILKNSQKAGKDCVYQFFSMSLKQRMLDLR